MRSFLEEELTELQAQYLLRRLRTLTNLRGSGTRAVLDGREITLFCGNDYLGLSHHPRVIKAFQDAAADYGVGAVASRLISGTSDLHTKLEEKIARFKKKEAALVFTAGYLANVGILTALAREGDLIVMDKLNHASIVDGARLSGAEVRVFPHKNYERCEKLLQSAVSNVNKGAGPLFARRILVSDTVFSMDGDVADLKELVRLKEQYECLLVVDDAHGTGVLGQNGTGAAEDLGLESKIDIVMGTLSKALGTLGGFAAASKPMIDYLINFARPFIFATALPPALCAAAHEALSVIESEPDLRIRLWQNARRVHLALEESGIKTGPLTSPIFPIILGEESRALAASEKLLKEGLLVPAVRPPAVPKGKARLRLTVSASHNPQEIECLLRALRALV